MSRFADLKLSPYAQVSSRDGVRLVLDRVPLPEAQQPKLGARKYGTTIRVRLETERVVLYDREEDRGSTVDFLMREIPDAFRPTVEAFRKRCFTRP